MKNIKRFFCTPITLAVLFSFVFSSGCTRLPEDTEQDLPVLGRWQSQCIASVSVISTGNTGTFVDQGTQTIYSFTSSGGIRKILKTVNQYEAKTCEEDFLASTLKIEGTFTLDESVETELVQQTIDISNYAKSQTAFTEQAVINLSRDYSNLEFAVGIEIDVPFTAQDIQLFDIFLIEVSETQSILRFGEKNETLDGQSEEGRPETLNSKISFNLIEN